MVKSGGGGDLEVWAGPLSRNRTVVALWNRGLTTATISASLELLGFEANSEVIARDVWKVRVSDALFCCEGPGVCVH